MLPGDSRYAKSQLSLRHLYTYELHAKNRSCGSWRPLAFLVDKVAHHNHMLNARGVKKKAHSSRRSKVSNRHGSKNK